MPQFDDSAETNSYPSVSLLIKTAFKNYEVAITKYEKLLVDNTTLNTLINEKLTKLPDEVKIKETLEKFADEAAERVQQQQDRLDRNETENTKETQKIVSDLNKIVDKLLYQFKIVLAWLSIVSVVGSLSLIYFKFVAMNLKQEEANIKPASIVQKTTDGGSQQLFIEVLDMDGNKITIPISGISAATDQKSVVKTKP
jgi:hypothetical protein